MDLCFVIYMFLSNNPSSGGYKFIEFVLFSSGALFASIGSVETLCSLLGTLTNNIVYAATLTIMNGFVFLVCAGCNFFAVIFLL